MTKLIIINDIHGNITALSKILEDIKGIKYNQIIFTGDLIGVGAHSNEVIDVVKTIQNKIVVKGNHEEYLISGFHNKNAGLEKEHHDWIKQHISTENQEYIKTFKDFVDLRIEYLNLHICHYMKYFGKMYPIVFENNYEKIISICKDINADLIIFGHNHFPQIFKKEPAIINVGSSGCTNIHPGYTRYGILSIDKNQYNLEVKELKYDITYERESLDKLNVPDRDMIKKVFFTI